MQNNQATANEQEPVSAVDPCRRGPKVPGICASALALTLVAHLGCSSSTDGKQAVPDGSSVSEETGLSGKKADAEAESFSSSSWEAACSAYVKALCVRMQACSAFGFSEAFGSLEVCQTRFGGENCKAQMRSPGSTATPDMLAACGAALGLQSCSDYDVALPPECNWRGNLASDAPCSYNQQCQSGRCALTGNSWCGSCKPLIAQGEPCPSPNMRSCETGLICADSRCRDAERDGGACQTGTLWVCTKPGVEGVDCIGNFECAWGLLCVGQKCVRGQRLGERCGLEPGCAADQDSICYPKQGESSCVAISRALAGEGCDESKGVYCIGQTTCRDRDGKSTSIGVCSYLVPDGKSCAGHGDCMYPSLCIGGICKSAADEVGSCK